jgi:hydrogenase maturation protease
MRVLVLGYGNRNRNDDGVAWHVLDELRAAPPAGAELVSSQQLQIDDAERVAECDLVVFVDAATPDAPEALSVMEATAASEPRPTTHHILPTDILAFARKFYGECPRAWIVRIRGRDFGFGSTLSAEAREAAEAAVGRIRELVAFRDSD